MSDTDFDKYVENCNWCSEPVKLVPSKPYCFDCKSKCIKECIRCHRPFNSLKYFKQFQDDKRCDVCMRKYLKEKISNDIDKDRISSGDEKKDDNENIEINKNDVSDEEEKKEMKEVKIIKTKKKKINEKKINKSDTSDDEEDKKEIEAVKIKIKKRKNVEHYSSEEDDKKKKKITKKSVKKIKIKKDEKKDVESMLQEWMSERATMSSFLNTRRLGFTPVYF